MADPVAETLASFTSLADLRPGEQCWVQVDVLDRSERALLMGLGLAGRSPVSVRQTGDPTIVEVRGTRVGLAESVARRLPVIRQAGVA